jgi:hypothetical protein
VLSETVTVNGSLQVRIIPSDWLVAGELVGSKFRGIEVEFRAIETYDVGFPVNAVVPLEPAETGTVINDTRITRMPTIPNNLFFILISPGTEYSLIRIYIRFYLNMAYEGIIQITNAIQNLF